MSSMKFKPTQNYFNFYPELLTLEGMDQSKTVVLSYILSKLRLRGWEFFVASDICKATGIHPTTWRRYITWFREMGYLWAQYEPGTHRWNIEIDDNLDPTKAHLKDGWGSNTEAPSLYTRMTGRCSPELQGGSIPDIQIGVSEGYSEEDKIEEKSKKKDKNNKGEYQIDAGPRDQLPEDPFTPDMATVRWNALATYCQISWYGVSNWTPKKIGSPDMDIDTREIFKSCGFDNYETFENMVVYLTAINQLHYQALESKSIKLQDGYLPGPRNTSLKTHMRTPKGRGQCQAVIRSVRNLGANRYKMEEAINNAVKFAENYKNEDSNNI